MNGLEHCPRIRRLILSYNQVTSLSSFNHNTLPSLVELDLSHNKISKIEELKNLIALPRLKVLNIKGNPLESSLEDGYRTSVLSILSTLERLDGKKVTEEELRQAAEETAEKEREERERLEEERRQKEEEERIRKEQEEEERRQKEEEERLRKEQEEEERRQKEEEERLRKEEV